MIPPEEIKILKEIMEQLRKGDYAAARDLIQPVIDKYEEDEKCDELPPEIVAAVQAITLVAAGATPPS